MEIHNLFSDKALKPKERTELLAKLIIENKIDLEQLIHFAMSSKDPIKATCIESLEFVTQKNPQLINEKTIDYIIQSLEDKAPRIKWESAKVIGNCIHLFPTKIPIAMHHLLKNTEHSGTVVRWSAAFAISQILKLKTKNNKELLPAVDAIVEREEKNSIQKIYLTALKKL